MAISAQDVKKLREQTGCGMMECKTALTDAPPRPAPPDDWMWRTFPGRHRSHTVGKDRDKARKSPYCFPFQKEIC